MLLKIYTDLGLSESCVPTSEEESSDDDCEEGNESLSCYKKPAVNWKI